MDYKTWFDEKDMHDVKIIKVPQLLINNAMTDGSTKRNAWHGLN